MTPAPTQAPAPQALVDAYGRPVVARTCASDACPRCGAGPDMRVPSAGFGTPTETCRLCAWEFKE